jgi:hypothetical protein
MVNKLKYPDSYQYNGTLGCFCKGKSFTSYDRFYTTSDGEKQLCYEYLKDNYTVLFLKNFVTFLIVVVNVIIKQFMMAFLKFIRYKRISSEMNSIMVWIFFSTFFNTGLLLLLV